MFNIDPDISKASTLPARFYRDREVFNALIERVLVGSWQLVGDLDALRAPGSVLPVTFLEGVVDEPLLLARDHEDRLHCLSNVCTHRGNLLVPHPGKEKSLVCAYHGRRFDLDGTCRFMPEFEKVQGFPSACDHLARVPFGLFSRHVFASLRPTASFEDMIGPMRARVGWMPLDEFAFDPGRSREYLVRAHWALYTENYLEGFHVPFVHASLSKVLDYGSYTTELHDRSILQVGVSAGGEDTFALPPGHPDEGKRVSAYYWWLWPNTMFNFYPWGLSINIVRPVAPDRTRVSFLTYVRDPALIDRGAGAGLDRVEREDESIVEAVQRGMGGRFYERGRYSPTREQGVHHFHRLLAASLA